MNEDTAVNIGEILREQREKLGYTLDDAAKKTCVRKTYLESIEKNNFSDLPGQAYVIGFIRVYAHHLGLDSNSLIAELKPAEVSAAKPSMQSVPVARPQSTRARQVARRKGRRSALFALCFLSLIGLAIYLVSSTAQQKLVTPMPAPMVQGLPEAGPPPLAEQSELIPPGTPEAAVEPAPAADPGQPVPAAEEVPPPAAPEQVTTTEAEPVSGPLPAIQPGGSLLRMLALSDSSLIIYLDGRKLHKYKLFNGLDLTWKVAKNVKIELAKPGVARFWLDGREVVLADLESFQLLPE